MVIGFSCDDDLTNHYYPNRVVGQTGNQGALHLTQKTILGIVTKNCWPIHLYVMQRLHARAQCRGSLYAGNFPSGSWTDRIMQNKLYCKLPTALTRTQCASIPSVINLKLTHPCGATDTSSISSIAISSLQVNTKQAAEDSIVGWDARLRDSPRQDWERERLVTFFVCVLFDKYTLATRFLIVNDLALSRYYLLVELCILRRNYR